MSGKAAMSGDDIGQVIEKWMYEGVEREVAVELCAIKLSERRLPAECKSRRLRSTS
jgi:hypothetical protein